jgi:Ca2+/Na+ antiporter
LYLRLSPTQYVTNGNLQSVKLGAWCLQVGLNSVIGAGSFVTSIVVGLVAIVAVSSSEVQLQRSVFFRDVGFYLAAIVVSLGAGTPKFVSC